MVNAMLPITTKLAVILKLELNKRSKSKKSIAVKDHMLIMCDQLISFDGFKELAPSKEVLYNKE